MFLAALGGIAWMGRGLDPVQVVAGVNERTMDWDFGAERQQDPASRAAARPMLPEDEPEYDPDPNAPPNSKAAGYDLAQPLRVKVGNSASGKLVVVPGTDKAAGRGKLMRYHVEVEAGVPFDAREFAAATHRILNDPRSWGHGGKMRFERVSTGETNFRIVLVSPALTDKLCGQAGLNTHGKVSCFARTSNSVTINAMRWGQGAPAYGEDLAGYREYLINHEVGHRLGHGHVGCPGRGKPAPVMVQQTKGVGVCKPNAWPFP